jgi:hypothetical protein
VKHVFDHIRLKAEEAVEAELFQQYGTDPEKLVSALQREAMVALKVTTAWKPMLAVSLPMYFLPASWPAVIRKLKAIACIPE